MLRSLASLFSCVLLCVCDCVCVQGLALHQGTRLVDPEAVTLKGGVTSTRGAHFGVCCCGGRAPDSGSVNRSPMALCLLL